MSDSPWHITQKLSSSAGAARALAAWTPASPGPKLGALQTSVHENWIGGAWMAAATQAFFETGAAGEEEGGALRDALLERDWDLVVVLDGDGRVWLRNHASNEEQIIDVDWQDRGFAGDSVHRYQAHVLAHLHKGERFFCLFQVAKIAID